MLDVTPIDGRFTLVNAYSMTQTDKDTLVARYNIDNSFFPYILDDNQIPRFIQGSAKDQNLFVFDVPAKHKWFTVPVSAVITDNTSIVIFTTPDTKYIFPIISRLLNEKLGRKDYDVPCVALDMIYHISNYFLDRIKSIDDKRVHDKKLLKDHTKHANEQYIAHLSKLRTLASGYVYSLASDHSLLESIKAIFGKKLAVRQAHMLNNVLVEYKQAEQEATFCFRRVRAVLRSFDLTLNMNEGRMLRYMTIIQFLVFPMTYCTGLYGENVGAGANGLPFAQTIWSTLLVAFIATAIFDGLTYLCMKHMRR